MFNEELENNKIEATLGKVLGVDEAKANELLDQSNMALGDYTELTMILSAEGSIDVQAFEDFILGNPDYAEVFGPYLQSDDEQMVAEARTKYIAYWRQKGTDRTGSKLVSTIKDPKEYEAYLNKKYSDYTWSVEDEPYVDEQMVAEARVKKDLPKNRLPKAVTDKLRSGTGTGAHGGDSKAKHKKDRKQAKQDLKNISMDEEAMLNSPHPGKTHEIPGTADQGTGVGSPGKQAKSGKAGQPGMVGESVDYGEYVLNGPFGDEWEFQYEVTNKKTGLASKFYTKDAALAAIRGERPMNLKTMTEAQISRMMVEMSAEEKAQFATVTGMSTRQLMVECAKLRGFETPGTVEQNMSIREMQQKLMEEMNPAELKKHGEDLQKELDKGQDIKGSVVDDKTNQSSEQEITSIAPDKDDPNKMMVTTTNDRGESEMHDAENVTQMDEETGYDHWETYTVVGAFESLAEHDAETPAEKQLGYHVARSVQHMDSVSMNDIQAAIEDLVHNYDEFDMSMSEAMEVAEYVVRGAGLNDMMEEDRIMELAGLSEGFKSFKRGLKGWDKNMTGLDGEKNTPMQMRKRVKGSDDEFLRSISGQDDGSDSAASVQGRMAKHELNKRKERGQPDASLDSAMLEDDRIMELAGLSEGPMQAHDDDTDYTHPLQHAPGKKYTAKVNGKVVSIEWEPMFGDNGEDEWVASIDDNMHDLGTGATPEEALKAFKEINSLNEGPLQAPQRGSSEDDEDRDEHGWVKHELEDDWGDDDDDPFNEEKIDEISSELANRYHRKSAEKAARHAKDAQDSLDSAKDYDRKAKANFTGWNQAMEPQSDDDKAKWREKAADRRADAKDDRRKLKNRVQGMDRAQDRMEEGFMDTVKGAWHVATNKNIRLISKFLMADSLDRFKMHDDLKALFSGKNPEDLQKLRSEFEQKAEQEDGYNLRQGFERLVSLIDIELKNGDSVEECGEMDRIFELALKNRD